VQVGKPPAWPLAPPAVNWEYPSFTSVQAATPPPA